MDFFFLFILIDIDRDAIVTWIKKKTGPGVYNITTVEEAEKIITSNDKAVLAYLNSLTVIHFLCCVELLIDELCSWKFTSMGISNLHSMSELHTLELCLMSNMA